MKLRLALTGVIATLSAVAISGAALAAGGGFGGPGTFTFKDTSAFAQFVDSSGNFMFVNVDRGVQTFKIAGVKGAPMVSGPETVLNYNIQSADGTTTLGFGCFIIPDSSFNVASDLSSATLNVDPSIETPCPGLLIPAGAGGRPGLAGVVPDAGGGGGGGGTPLTANLTWTYDGAVTTSNFTSHTRCQGTVATNNGSSSSTPATLSGSTSGLTDIVNQFASIQRSSIRNTITGNFSSACTGF